MAKWREVNETEQTRKLQEKKKRYRNPFSISFNCFCIFSPLTLFFSFAFSQIGQKEYAGSETSLISRQVCAHR